MLYVSILLNIIPVESKLKEKGWVLVMSEIKFVAIYLRLSRDEDDIGIETLLENHRSILIEHCKKKKWKYEIYEEIASGEDPNRPKLNAMLEKVKNNEYDAVVVRAIDRLSRSRLKSAEIQQILAKNRTSIATPQYTFKWDNLGDTLSLEMLEIFAAHELRVTKERFKTGKLGAAKNGYWTDGIPPLGYSKNMDTRKLEPNDQAEHIRFIFNSIVQGKIITHVCNELNGMGIKTRTGKKFSFNSILRIVNNEVYKGTIISNKILGKHTGIRPENEWVVVENAHEALIDEETWERAKTLANANKFSRRRADVKTYPTSKIMYCGNCGRHQTPRYYPRLDKFYLATCRGPECRNRAFQYSPILNMIKDDILKHREDVLASILTIEDNNDVDEREYKTKYLETHLVKVERALANIELLFEEGEIDLQRYRIRKQSRIKEIKQLRFELEQVKKENLTNKLMDLNDVLKQVNYLLNHWEIIDGEGLTNEEINRALHFIIERMEWTYMKSNVEPILKIVFKK